MNILRGALSSLVAAALSWGPAVGQQTVEQVTAALAGVYEPGAVDVDGVEYSYRLLRPLPASLDRARPLVVFLHGAGERGGDNRRQLYWLPRELASDAARAARPCFVLAVQCPAEERWVEVAWGDAEPTPMPARPGRAMRAVQQAMRRVLAEPGVDRNRVYLTGLSMGGFGTWDLLAREPDTFAAALAVCGGGDPATVDRFAAVPIEVWHGAADAVVPVERSRQMVVALRERGAPCRYHELEGVGHDVWKQAYGEAGGLEWLFAQDQRQQLRGDAAEPAIVPRPDLLTRLPGRFQLLLGARCVVDERLRGVALAVLDRLDLSAVRRPGVVVDIEPSDGDVILGLDPSLGHGYELRIGARVELRAGDEAAAWRGGAALLQALRTWPDGAAPCGLVRQRAAALRGRLRLAAADGPRSRADVAALLDACWFAGVGELQVDDPDERAALVAMAADLTPCARDLGLAIVGPDGRSPAALAFDSGGRVGDVLQVPVPPGLREAAIAFELGAAPGPVAQQLAAVRRLLPALAERVARGDGPVHFGSFLVRQAAQRRRP
ncbi:MAG: prolyl oligopeptidase family serine peptidase [Planctomycetes bacterium]|nr:prolyl oligopeptidase family serine peptidase [Planctomycetota bacterium]